MSSRSGKLIVIDGIDGSGKSTQIELLSKYLTEKNIPFEVINFPRYGQNLYANLVTRYLEGEFGSIHEVNPHLMALVYAGDRTLAKPLIENWLSSGKVVIANRYVSASKAHLGANLEENKREEFMAWLDRLEYQTNGMPREDLTILLSVDPKIGQENVSGSGKPDIHEQNLNHLKEAQIVYLELSKAKEDWVVVNCMEGNKMRSKEDINKDIVDILGNRCRIF